MKCAEHLYHNSILACHAFSPITREQLEGVGALYILYSTILQLIIFPVRITNLTFEVLMTMTVKVTEYWDVMPPYSSKQLLSVSWKRK